MDNLNGIVRDLITGRIVSSLQYVIYAKQIEEVKRLLEMGENINNKGYITMNGVHLLQGLAFTPLEVASCVGSIELVKLLLEKGATVGDVIYKVPNGAEGDLVAGYLQTRGSKPVTRF